MSNDGFCGSVRRVGGSSNEEKRREEKERGEEEAIDVGQDTAERARGDEEKGERDAKWGRRISGSEGGEKGGAARG